METGSATIFDYWKLVVNKGLNLDIFHTDGERNTWLYKRKNIKLNSHLYFWCFRYCIRVKNAIIFFENVITVVFSRYS